MTDAEEVWKGWHRDEEMPVYPGGWLKELKTRPVPEAAKRGFAHAHLLVYPTEGQSLQLPVASTGEDMPIATCFRGLEEADCID